ncbi:class I SAM-dependent methyltransferase [Spirillospora sp. CA-294931]|uniref:class I SAM-dependent methyltransferase n=1 Tax=Spirillospora sp. CA-294931 TaxID=3240042 RepID=UPI003D8DB3CB
MTEYAIVTQAQQKAWSLGDLGKLAAHTPPVYAESLCEDLDLQPGERVLDVAAGTGTTSIAALRRFCEVVATDFVPESLVQATRLAEAEGLELEVHTADAQELPFEDDFFDVAVSTFGTMFAPDQQRTAEELLRVVRPGGRIGVLSWCPDGIIGDYAATIGKYIAAPPGLRSPFEWGTDARVHELFDGHAKAVRTVRRAQPFRYPSVQFAVEYFRAWYGPARGAFARLDEEHRTALHADMTAVWSAGNRATNGSLVAYADYLQTIVVKA